ncbi:Ig-like domain-containing protein [Oerskovia sp. M15]
MGDDLFFYQGVDVHGEPVQGTVQIRVLAAPSILDQHHRTPRNMAVGFEPILPALDTGYQSELELHAVGTPEHGTVLPGDDGTLVYVPDFGYLGMDHLTVQARDTWGRTAAAMVTIEVYGELDPTPPPGPDETLPVEEPVPSPSGDLPDVPVVDLPEVPGSVPAARSLQDAPSATPAFPEQRAVPGSALASTGASVAAMLVTGVLVLSAGVAACSCGAADALPDAVPHNAAGPVVGAHHRPSSCLRRPT